MAATLIGKNFRIAAALTSATLLLVLGLFKARLMIIERVHSELAVGSAAVVEDPAAARGQDEAAQLMPNASCFRVAAAGAPHSRVPFEDLTAALDYLPVA